MNEAASKPRLRAAQYLRASTEHQRYSTSHQAAAIANYAVSQNLEVVRTYEDDGFSGLSIRNRTGLQALLADVLSGATDFSAILVYDVSRWGRFQNPDQSAHYEFLCTEAGYRVEYCAEAFENDGSVASTLLKSLKRVMAAEFSRELSVKVALAHDRLARMGFWQGGPAPYGLRRRSLTPGGRLGPILEFGEFKGISADRTVLVAGPDDEVETIRRVFRLYVHAGLTAAAIARLLNREGVPGFGGAPWRAPAIIKLLTNRLYVGEMTFRKTTGALGQTRARRPRKEWVCVPGSLEPLVTARLFRAAQKARAHRNVAMTTPEMLEALKRLYDTHGALSHKIIRTVPGLPKGAAFSKRFGGMAGACEAIGQPRRAAPRASRLPLATDTILERLHLLLKRQGYLSAALIDADPSLPRSRTLSRRFGGLGQVYLLVGYADFDPEELTSQVGRAREEAFAIRRARALGELPRPAQPNPEPQEEFVARMKG